MALHSRTRRMRSHPFGCSLHLPVQEWRKNTSTSPAQEANSAHSLRKYLSSVEGNGGGVHEILIPACN